MEIVLKRSPITSYLYSYPQKSMICINTKRKWKEVIRSVPVYTKGEGEVREEILSDFVTRALLWECFLKGVNDAQGIGTAFLLDKACLQRKDFYDMFLGIHH